MRFRISLLGAVDFLGEAVDIPARPGRGALFKNGRVEGWCMHKGFTQIDQ